MAAFDHNKKRTILYHERVLEAENARLLEELRHIKEDGCWYLRQGQDCKHVVLRQQAEDDAKRLRKEKAELAKALKDIISLAEMAMEMANNDGGEFDIDDHLSEARAALNKLQPCGHPASEIVSSDEGTSYCGACEREAKDKNTHTYTK